MCQMKLIKPVIQPMRAVIVGMYSLTNALL